MIRRSFSRLRLLLMLLAAVPLAAQTPTRLPADKVEKIEAVITAAMARENIPGLSVAIVADHQLRFANGYGFADLENKVPAKATTVYRLASISKTITAVAVMQLAERGQLDLDAPIEKYCPAFPEKRWPITARQLLAHLGGIRHYKSRNESNSTRHYPSLVAGLAMFKHDPLLHEPGTKFHYTTFGYSLLGCALQGASGMSYMDYVRENIFRPAAMVRMRADNVYEIIPNRAQGYRQTQSGELRNSSLADTSYKIPGGGLCSTVEDLAKFALALQTAALVKQETLEQMWTPQKTRDDQQIRRRGAASYGLGWSLVERNGRKEVGHGGAQQRVSTFLYMLPEEEFALVLMVNLEGIGSRLRVLARQIADIVLE
ncbi:MAG: serine hydrolase domain-containing protein [Terriglobia bacterium]